jgi:hypothetical protein
MNGRQVETAPTCTNGLPEAGRPPGPPGGEVGDRSSPRARTVIRRRFSGRGGTALTLVLGIAIASASTAGAASLITGKQIKDGTISKKELSKAVRKQLATTGPAGATGAQGAPGAQGPAGNNGAPGARGTNGANGTNATINGVAAGGDVTGTFPNPSIKPRALTTAAFDAAVIAPTRASSADTTRAPTSPEAARSPTPPATTPATRSRSAHSRSATLAPPPLQLATAPQQRGRRLRSRLDPAGRQHADVPRLGCRRERTDPDRRQPHHDPDRRSQRGQHHRRLGRMARAAGRACRARTARRSSTRSHPARGTPNGGTRRARAHKPSPSGSAVTWSISSPCSVSRQTSSRVRLRSNPACNMKTGLLELAPR